MARISVLLATRNRPQLLCRSVARLFEGLRLPDELIIVDQSDDSLVAQLPTPPPTVELMHLHVATRGKSNAINLALQRCTGDLLAFTDDDVLVDVSWLEVAERLASERSEFDAFCGRVLPEPGTVDEQYINLVPELEARVIDRTTNPVLPSVCGANLCVRRDALVAAGGFNPHFGPGHLFRSNDDGELAYRLTRHGSQIRYSPDLVVYHMGWRGEVDNQALTYDYAFSLGGFAGYYLRKADLRPAVHLLRMFAFKGVDLVRGVVRADARSSRAAWIHLHAISQGFIRGVRVSTSGGTP